MSRGLGAYRVVDGALVVMYIDDEFRVELPRWSMEEVHAIVECIQRSKRSLFHEVMSWGKPEGSTNSRPISEGNERILPGVVAIRSLEPLPENGTPSSVDE